MKEIVRVLLEFCERVYVCRFPGKKKTMSSKILVHSHYKTLFCTDEHCAAGAKCLFAHCVGELRVTFVSGPFKQQNCPEWTNHACPNGRRCVMLHDEIRKPFCTTCGVEALYDSRWLQKRSANRLTRLISAGSVVVQSEDLFIDPYRPPCLCAKPPCAVLAPSASPSRLDSPRISLSSSPSSSPRSSPSLGTRRNSPLASRSPASRSPASRSPASAASPASRSTTGFRCVPRCVPPCSPRSRSPSPYAIGPILRPSYSRSRSRSRSESTFQSRDQSRDPSPICIWPETPEPRQPEPRQIQLSEQHQLFQSELSEASPEAPLAQLELCGQDSFLVGAATEQVAPNKNASCPKYKNESCPKYNESCPKYPASTRVVGDSGTRESVPTSISPINLHLPPPRKRQQQTFREATAKRDIRSPPRDAHGRRITRRVSYSQSPPSSRSGETKPRRVQRTDNKAKNKRHRSHSTHHSTHHSSSNGSHSTHHHGSKHSSSTHSISNDSTHSTGHHGSKHSSHHGRKRSSSRSRSPRIRSPPSRPCKPASRRDASHPLRRRSTSPTTSPTHKKTTSSRLSRPPSPSHSSRNTLARSSQTSSRTSQTSSQTSSSHTSSIRVSRKTAEFKAEFKQAVRIIHGVVHGGVVFHGVHGVQDRLERVLERACECIRCADDCPDCAEPHTTCSHSFCYERQCPAFHDSCIHRGCPFFNPRIAR